MSGTLLFFCQGPKLSCVLKDGLEAWGREEAPGLWVECRKLASIGISLRHGVSLHGLALNVSLDLTPFSWIAPCGMDIVMTSLERELGTAPSMEAVKGVLVESFVVLCPLEKRILEEENSGYFSGM